MIETNTNKLMWVSVSIGLIAILGLGAMSQTIIYEAATPKTTINNKSIDLTYSDFEYHFGALEYSLNDGHDIITKPKKWGLMELYFKSNLDLKYARIDINTYITNNVHYNTNGNDNDAIEKRNIKWYDAHGNLLNNEHTDGISNLKANDAYHVVIRWYNNKNYNLYQKSDKWHNNHIGFRPVNGINENTTMKIKVWGFREY